MNIVDLHVHSNKSDGSYTPAELVSYALEKGLSAFALTDHDTTEGLAEAMEASKDQPVEVIPGIEFSTEYEGRDIHILGLFIDYEEEQFKKHLIAFQQSRITRNEKMCARLSEAGIDITYDALLSEFPGSVITRAHYAKYLLAHGYTKSMKEAFERYVGDNCPYFVPREKVTPVQAVKLILQSHGIPILAHPPLYHMGKERLDTLISTLADAGLMGIEAVYSTYCASEEREMKALAKKYNLCISGGSDFHGNTKPGLDLAVGYGKLFIPEEILDNLKKRIFEKKIFFTDLDGTLLNDEKQVSPALHNVLRKMQEMGHIIVLSSGRPLSAILPVKDMLQLDNEGLYISANNGSQILDCSTDICIMESRISYEDMQYIFKIAQETDTYCHTYTDTHIITPKDGPELALYTKHIHMPYICTDNIFRELEKEPFKILAIHATSHEHLETFKRALYPWAENRIATLFSNPLYLELFPATAGKGNALRELCSRLHIPLENSLAAGDMDNDISMLEAAGTGVAMANATEGVKSIADIVTQTDNNHDGLLPILKDFFHV